MSNVFQYLCEYLFHVSFQEHDSLATLNKDLTALLQGSVNCRKGKPPSTKETKKEAFDCYMKIIYGLPPNIKVSSSSPTHFTCFFLYFQEYTDFWHIRFIINSPFTFPLIHCGSLKLAPMCVSLKKIFLNMQVKQSTSFFVKNHMSLSSICMMQMW